MKLQDIPVELRQNIFELSLTAPVAPSSPSESQHGRYRRVHDPQDRYWRPTGVWEQAPNNKALSLLLVSKQFHAEVQDGGCGGPEPAVWAFYVLLIGLIEYGPRYLGRLDNCCFIINEIEVDVVAPTDGAAHTKLEFRDNENPVWLYRSRIRSRDERVPEKRLISYMTNELEYVFSATRYTIEYCLELHEHITESIIFKVSGQE
ncbi:hypothetical protein FOYG_13793 [Fusarium oxysporum NRRL 32931]|uniref:Uncharacterized protein n=1 Tax=Fusarium oxysporum NRRL 32931 TaxID=660029 RepID=W9HT59_FUSOX|nr:hypothetical protein FOYG_13793 [Fusarium oxysporum NRRL 32931]